jgi:pullulanase
MGRKFIVDSCVFWAKEYGVSGFRFDLMGLIDFKTLQEIRDALHEVDPTIIVYGEPWAAAGSGLGEITHKGKIAGTGIGAFNDHFRDAVKGSTRGGHPGFVQNGSQENKVVSGLAGSLDDWAKQPTDSISYVACHDDLCLWDKIAVSSPGASEADRIKMHRMALALVLVAQGKAFIHGGEEFLRTKNGVENSYNAPDSVNRLDWLLKAKHLASYEYVRGIIAIRRAHPMFRLNDRAVVLRRVRFGDGAAPGLIVMEIDGEGVPGETWKRVRVACNATAKGYALQLPAGKWNVAVRGDKASAESLGTVEGQVVVEPRTTLMVWR